MKIWFCLLLVCFVKIEAKSDGEYGPYRVTILNMTYCPVTRPVHAMVNVTWMKLDKADIIRAVAELKKEVGPIGMRVRVWKQEAVGSLQSMLNFRPRNICAHPLGKELMRLLPSVKSDCTIAKGHYELNIADLDKLIHSIAGEKYYFGTYLSHVEVLVKHIGKSLCLKMFSQLVPL